MIGNETIWRDYDKLETIGQGVYGKVYKARSRYNGEIVAIKKTAYDPEGIAASTVREIAMLKRIGSHANIVQLQHVFRSPSKNTPSTLNILVVMEYADYDLQRYIENYNPLPVDQIKRFTFQILNGLNHCHELGIIHRDLKPGNILVHAGHLIKIADFGLSRRQYFPHVAVSPNTVTQIYRPPEIFLEAKYYHFSTDIWSLGCIFAEMYRGRPLFIVENNSAFAVLAEIHRKLGTPSKEDIPYSTGFSFNFNPTPPDVSLESLVPNCNQDGLDLLSEMLQYNPYKRIIANSAMKHRFFF